MSSLLLAAWSSQYKLRSYSFTLNRWKLGPRDVIVILSRVNITQSLDPKSEYTYQLAVGRFNETLAISHRSDQGSRWIQRKSELSSTLNQVFIIKAHTQEPERTTTRGSAIYIS